jgi:hypothetical protein
MWHENRLMERLQPSPSKQHHTHGKAQFAGGSRGILETDFTKLDESIDCG